MPENVSILTGEGIIADAPATGPGTGGVELISSIKKAVQGKEEGSEEEADACDCEIAVSGAESANAVMLS